MAQNTSHAVMAQRVEEPDSLDDFPTPPWGTRAFLSHYFERQELADLSVWEPACGRGHMAQVLAEFFGTVRASDVADYGYGDVQDFLTGLSGVESVDWVITKASSTPLTPGLAQQIREFQKENPDLHQRAIAEQFNVNPGRVSEALNNLK